MSVGETKRRAIAVHSRQAAQFAQRYADVPTHPYRSCFSYSRRRLEVAVGRLLAERGDGRRLLDVGCGTGHHLALLRQRGFDVAGVDGSEDMLSLARANNPGVPITLGDVEALPFPSGEFDIVLCIEVFRYLPRLAGCLRELARVLKPGGLCFATAAPPLNLNGYWLVNRVVSAWGLPGFTRLKQSFHTANRLRREFEATGFECPRIQGVYFGPVNWVERFAPRVLPAILRRWEPIDSLLADQPVLRDFSNMFLVHAVRGRSGG